MENTPGRFTGSFFRSLDSKGRFLMPPGFLQVLKKDDVSQIWCTAFYGRLVSYLPKDWEETVKQLCSIPFPSPKLANFKTKILGLAEELQPDGQGRIKLSRPLIREASLEKDIVLVGMLNKFEIWSRVKFEAIPDEDVSSELQVFGINLKL